MSGAMAGAQAAPANDTTSTDFATRPPFLVRTYITASAGMQGEIAKGAKGTKGAGEVGLCPVVRPHPLLNRDDGVGR
jgi:hypothetical protein